MEKSFNRAGNAIGKLVIVKLLFLLLAFAIIITMTTVYFVNDMNTLSAIGTGILFITDIYLIISNKNIRLEPFRVFLFILYYILSFIYFIFKGQDSLGCINYLLFVYPATFLLIDVLRNSNLVNEFLKIYIVLSSVIGIVSVVMYLLITILGFLHFNTMYYLEWGVRHIIPSFYNIFFMTQYGRNTAFFTEGPAANFAFCIPLLLNIYVVKYKPKVINTLLIIIIISTNTTTGYIVLTLCAIGAVYNVKGRSEISKVIIGVIIVITLIIGLHIIDNLFSSKLSSLSGQIRWKKIIDELSVFLNHPIFGDGFGKHTSGSSNSITALLADGGIFLWGLYYFPIILNAVVCFIKTKKIDFFSITYMFLLAVSVFHNTMMAILMTVIFYNRLFSLLKKKYINHIKFRR